MLVPAGAAITIEGPVTCHPAQRVFGGTGVNGPVVPSNPLSPTVTVGGSAFGNYRFFVRIETGGPLGEATFRYALDGGVSEIAFSWPPQATAAIVPLPMTGLTIGFGLGAYTNDEHAVDTYSWTSLAPITLGPAAFDRFSVRNFGAVPDYDPMVKTPTDNLPFFHAALAAMAASGNRSAKLLVDGHFFLGDTLVLTQTVVLEGTGMNEPPPFPPSRSTPGTLLVFPRDVTGIRIRSMGQHDHPPASAERTVLRDLTICCEEPGATGDGVHATALFFAENVTIQNFARDGFNVTAGLEKSDGNTNGTVVRTCVASRCGRDGFHFEGGDANACVIDGCSGAVNGRAGFFDATFGNTYLGCLSEGNSGPNYITEQLINASVFINCWSEGGSPPSQFKGAVTIISGKIGGDPAYMTPDSSAFILEHGVASRAPLVYKNLAGAKAVECSLGNLTETVQGPGTEMVAFALATLLSAEDQNVDDFMSLRYYDASSTPRGQEWWAWEHSNSLYRHMIRFPTRHAFARLPAPWFVNGIFLGRDEVGPPRVGFTAAPSLPNTQDDGAPLTYERGDVVWKSDPMPGEPIGQVCIASGTQSMLLGYQTIEAVNAGDTVVKLNKVNGLASQYITIGRGTNVYRIVNVTPGEPSADPPVDPTIEIVPGAIGDVPEESAIAFTSPTAESVVAGDATVEVMRVDGRTPGQYVTIAGGTEVYVIVRIHLPTIEIAAPGALEDSRVGAGIALVGGAPLGIVTTAPLKMGDTTLTLDEVDGLEPGQFITINGKNTHEILKVTRPAIGLDRGVLTGVPAGQAIAFSPATFSTFGEVTNLGKSIVFDASEPVTALALADRFVTVTQNGTVLRLPASPQDGQTHSAKCGAGVTTTVDTADGILIDGALTATVAPLENQTFRYSAATAEWEIR